MKSYRLKENQYACPLVRPDERRPSIRTKPFVFATLLFVTLGVITQSGCGGLTSAGAPNTNSGAPSLTTQPASQTVTAGQTATFSVAATGTAPLSYQWQKNGAAIIGATSSTYTTPATTTSDNGAQFTVVVSNSAGSVTSNAASLTVNPPQPLQITTTSSLPSGQTQTSYSASLQATGGTPPYAWSVISGQLPNGLSLSPSSGTITGTPTLAGAFTFTIQVKDNSGGSASAGFSISITTTSLTPQFGHAVIVVEENTNYADVVGSASMPYLNSLINQFGLATQYFANTHPSIGNYMMWATGQILTNDDSQTPSTFPVSSDNIAREMELAGKTWKDYRELTGTYYVRHDPLAYMTNINTANLVSFTQFATDLANGTLPIFSWIAPNGCDDAHDCPLSTADSWLRTNIDPLIKNPMFQKDGLLVIVFDESGNDNTSGGGRVAAVLISPPFSRVAYQSSTFYQHESVLRLMLEGLGVKTLPGAAATAPPMWEFFVPPGGTITPLAISTTSLPAGSVGQAYSPQLNATGGTTPYTWSVASGSLPSGLTLSSSGAISGIPTAAGTSTFTVKLTDFNLLTAQQSFSISAGSGSGLNYYVSPTGSDTNVGSALSPWKTIQHAAQSMGSGPNGVTVHVAAGTYAESVSSSLSGTASGRVRFVSDVPWAAKIDALNASNGWTVSGDYQDIVGFEIYNAARGGVVYTSSHVRILQNKFHDIAVNTPCDSGGGAAVEPDSYSNSDAEINGNMIYNIGPGAGKTRCNTIHGIYFAVPIGTAINNLISTVTGDCITSWHYATNLTIENNTVMGCLDAGILIGADSVTHDNTVVANNIVIDSPYAGIAEEGSLGTHNQYSDNLIYNVQTPFIWVTGSASGTITSNPLVVNDGGSISTGDYHLTVGSPAIDSGANQFCPITDFDGYPRPYGNTCDIGAYEWHR